MSLSRAMLKGLGLSDDQINGIIDGHTETVNSLKAERDAAQQEQNSLAQQIETLKKEKAELEGKNVELTKAQADLAKAQADLKAMTDANGKLKKEYDDYKAGQEKAAVQAKKESLLKAVAKDAGLSDAGIAKAIKYMDYDNLALDEKGEAFKDQSSIIKGLKAEWPEYLQVTQKNGAQIQKPDTGTGAGAMTIDDIMAIEDQTERQAAIAQNISLFQ